MLGIVDCNNSENKKAKVIFLRFRGKASDELKLKFVYAAGISARAITYIEGSVSLFSNATRLSYISSESALRLGCQCGPGGLGPAEHRD